MWAEVRSILFLRVFENMSALLLMVGEIINDTRESLILLTMLTFAMAHVFVSGRYFPTNYIAVLFRAVGIGVLGDGFPEEFLPEESPPDTTALAIKIAIFLICTYGMNMVLICIGLTRTNSGGDPLPPNYGKEEE